MGRYETAKLRNLGIVAHGGAGKTSLAEAILFDTGMIDRLGRVDDGTSTMDYEPEEVKRRISITSSLDHCEWHGCSIHLVDTPGYGNFIADTRACMRTLDCAVVILSAISGVKVQTEEVWQWANEFEIPRIAFVNKMDRERANFFRAIDDMEKALGARGVAVQIPLGSEENFEGVIDLVRMKAYRYQKDGSGKFSEGEIPADDLAEAQRLRDLMVETVAEAYDALTEKFLDTGELTEEEILDGLRVGTLRSTFTAVFCGSATANIGIAQLLDGICAYLPSPLDRTKAVGIDPKTEQVIERAPSESEPLSALVFKTTSDPYTGKITIFRVYSGVLNSDSLVYNSTKEVQERIGQIYELEGKKQHPIKQAVAGDIVAVAKLKETVTGDTLCDETKPIVYEPAQPLQPVISYAIEPKTKADEDKIHSALQRMIEEDPTIESHRDPQTREFIISGMGQVHLEVIVEKMKRKFGADVLLKTPKVPYLETIRGSAKVQGKYKKQSGGRGQYGDCWIELSPLPRGEGYLFEDKIVGGVIPRQYIPAVDKGIQEAAKEGFLAGNPVVDFKVALYDGSFHTVDSSEMAFKVAGSMAFKKAMEQCKPVLLEPIVNMKITVPDENMGDVIGDLNSRRGKVVGVEPKANSQIIRSVVPMSEVLTYSNDLRSMTSDRGMFTSEFSHYEEVPSHLAQKIIQEALDQKGNGNNHKSA
ncbi:translation elongation factor G [Citrifermentans bemidjiense Bem]|uniref:Elongation factor G n=1 Tax=Citrifermentans bemidjiense (strain ATCC BAA-1014 / DSM 16622 / JCM 12645 / Bem) TaxID=404380 RepID=B5EF21_CITBB|nr:elongation factor G [Citrifermentans bemidjiense]ACH39330.1 translation elongation factor G [Citrifermentans bemidjiense Bem]